MSARAAFGPRLRAHRERRGITLESIADNTKIKLSMLAGLERSDVSRWPRGIFRRAYVRDYAVAIGLDPQPLVAEFIHLFPENGSTPEAAPPSDGASARTNPAMRLNLAVEPRDHIGQLAARTVAALAELALVLGVGGLAALLSGTSFLATAGLVALLYYPLAAVCTGRALDLRQLPASFRRLVHVLIAQTHATRRRRMRLVPRHPLAADDDAIRDGFARNRRSAAS